MSQASVILDAAIVAVRGLSLWTQHAERGAIPTQNSPDPIR
jgi:hypothetical protein